MGTVTDFFHRQTPHLTPALILGSCSFLGPFLGIFSTGFHSLATSKDTVHLGLEIVSIVGHSAEVGCLGLFAFMSQTYGRFLKAKEDQKKLDDTNVIPKPEPPIGR